MTHYDVYISYAKNDSAWVKEFIEEIESKGLKACWDARDFDPEISPRENRNKLIQKCSSCVLVFSKSYCKRASEWSFFLPYVEKKQKDGQKSVGDLLENKFIIGVNLSECNIPNLFSKEIILNWTEIEYSDIFWSKLVKYLKAAKKRGEAKERIARQLNPESNQTVLDISHKSGSSNYFLKSNAADKNEQIDLEKTQKTEFLDSNENKEPYINSGEIFKEEEVHTRSNHDINDKNNNTNNNNRNTKDCVEYHQEVESDDKLDEMIANTSHYKMFDNVYPHLISTSFSAEDDDLTKAEVDSLTLKMEEIKTIILLNEKFPEQNVQTSKKTQEFEKPKSEFDSQHEQMQLLDVLQSLSERTQSVLDKLPTDRYNMYLVSRKKRLRRVLQRYQECIMKVVNGKKDVNLIKSLPLVSDYLLEIELMESPKCHCCNMLYHSRRALDIHLPVCVQQQWKEIMNRKVTK